jgi:hypothetical protein
MKKKQKGKRKPRRTATSRLKRLASSIQPFVKYGEMLEERGRRFRVHYLSNLKMICYIEMGKFRALVKAFREWEKGR